MADETIVIKGGSVEMVFGSSLASESATPLETLSTSENRKYVCQDKRIKKILIEDAGGAVQFNLEEEEANGLRCKITIVYGN